MHFRHLTVYLQYKPLPVERRQFTQHVRGGLVDRVLRGAFEPFPAEP